MLEVLDIRFSYSDHQPLSQFDLSVPEHSAFVVAGASGTGKSTLLALIAGFLTPQSGDIRWHGQSLLGLSPAERPISILFQNDNLFPHLDVWTNIALGIDASLKLTPSAASLIRESMADLGIGDMETRAIPTLSGGQQQRVALVRALVRARIGNDQQATIARPLLLLDEPFSALDPETKANCLGVVRHMVDQFGITAVLVTHDPSDATTLDADVFSLKLDA
jgi:thiamine transport system ATP-binding protein